MSFSKNFTRLVCIFSPENLGISFILRRRNYSHQPYASGVSSILYMCMHNNIIFFLINGVPVRLPYQLSCYYLDSILYVVAARIPYLRRICCFSGRVVLCPARNLSFILSSIGYRRSVRTACTLIFKGQQIS
jgi:hypothetical protein